MLYYSLNQLTRIGFFGARVSELFIMVIVIQHTAK